MKLILGGHYMGAPEGWLALSEDEQDMTKPFPWQDNSVTTLYSEHCGEHLLLNGLICYFKEGYRVLKNGGVLRTIMPTIDKLIQFKNDEAGQSYCTFQTAHYYPNEDAQLRELGLNGVNEDPIVFMFDSLFKGHNHKLLWTSQLVKKVLERIGFSEVHICEPGETHFDKSDCLERILRGIHPNDAERLSLTHYDPESKVIEAKK